MPRMKLDDDEFDPEELDVEWEEGDFQRYDGEIPRTGTILIGRVTKAWWTYSADSDSMIKLIVVAEDNTGRLEEFNGLPAWENLTFKTSAAFKYQPFLEHFGVKLTDIKKKMIVSDTDDNIGTPIEKIGDWEVGSDDALTRFVVKRERYLGQWQAKIDRWLPYDEEEVDEDEEPEDEEEEEERPRGGRRRAPAASSDGRRQSRPASRRRAEPVDEHDEEDEEEEPEEDEEEERPRRGRSAPASRPASRSKASSSRPARSASTRTGASAKAGAARRRSRKDEGSADDPPF